MFSRVLVKVSGEAFCQKGQFGVDAASADAVAEQIKKVADSGIKVGVVVGGGNMIRGRLATTFDREKADYMGMTATVINGIALSAALNKIGVGCSVLSPLKYDTVAELCSSENIEKAFAENKVIVFVCGTGRPFVSTDTGASMRAVDMHADVILCAKNIDGVYDSDPKVNPNAKRLDKLTYDEVLSRRLHALDTEAVEMCRDNKIKILVFAADEKDSVYNASTKGKINGTVIG